ncbi:MAG TPA: alpha/beta hydrolase [Saprospiraceae bacterium]|nr:alpha/beta hydrolase [Saprospiraceae bacterium]
MNRKILLIYLVLLSINASAQIGKEMFLYENRQTAGEPALFINLAKTNPTKAAVLIIPGGGYTMIAMSHEGNKVAEWFNERGVHAFILRYSLGKFDGSGSKHPDMINDAKRAFRIIRSNAGKWGIDKNKIGVMGFSAGGHLASTLCTHFDDGNKNATDIIERESCLPNFCILAYPVITMEDSFTHWGSRRFLLGPTPSKKDIHELSNETQVSGITPPTFLFHTSDDKSVPVQNSIAYYLALRKYGIPVEMHIFEHGNHGVGLVVDDFALKQWSSLLENWLTRWKVIDKK